MTKIQSGTLPATSGALIPFQQPQPTGKVRIKEEVDVEEGKTRTA